MIRTRRAVVHLQRLSVPAGRDGAVFRGLRPCRCSSRGRGVVRQRGELLLHFSLVVSTIPTETVLFQGLKGRLKAAFCQESSKCQWPVQFTGGRGSVGVPTLWNSLPTSIHDCTDLPSFKSPLKTHPLQTAFHGNVFNITYGST